jgi:hypothetical protein
LPGKRWQPQHPNHRGRQPQPKEKKQKHHIKSVYTQQRSGRRGEGLGSICTTYRGDVGAGISMGKCIAPRDEVLRDITAGANFNNSSLQFGNDGFVASSNTIHTCDKRWE